MIQSSLIGERLASAIVKVTTDRGDEVELPLVPGDAHDLIDEVLARLNAQ